METKNNEKNKADEKIHKMNKDIIDKINNGKIEMFVNIKVDNNRAITCEVTGACKNGPFI